MNIFLIGCRCTGKTTVGRILAETHSLHFVDTDDVIVREMGRSIRSIVDEKGWDHFRRWETKVMMEVCAGDGQVVGTGGGIILNPENIAVMRRSGTVAWLKAKVETIIRRMETDQHTRSFRPSLTGKSASAEVGELLPQRESLYQKAADIEVATDDKSPQMIADEITARLRKRKYDNHNRNM